MLIVAVLSCRLLWSTPDTMNEYALQFIVQFWTLFMIIMTSL